MRLISVPPMTVSERSYSADEGTVDAAGLLARVRKAGRRRAPAEIVAEPDGAGYEALAGGT